MLAPDTKPVNFYDATRFIVDEIIMGRNVVLAKTRAFDIATAALSGSFNDRKAADLQASAETLDTVSADLSKIAGQMQQLAATVAKQTAALLAREAEKKNADAFEDATEVYGDRT